jgi:hypothetical protein
LKEEKIQLLQKTRIMFLFLFATTLHLVNGIKIDNTSQHILLYPSGKWIRRRGEKEMENFVPESAGPLSPNHMCSFPL